MKCEHCEKEFADQEALGQHMQAKHGVAMRRFRVKPSFILYGIIAMMIATAGYFVYNSAIAPGIYDDFATCLSEKGLKFYGAFWCVNCERQKQLFGKSAEFLPYIECSTPDKKQNQICIDAQIENYPTWAFPDGTRQVGVKSLQDLSQASGCSYA